MRVRFLSVAFLLASLFTGLTWVLFQPLLLRSMKLAIQLEPSSPSARWIQQLQRAIPLYLALDFLVLAVVAYAVLYAFVIRPLREVELTASRLEQLDLAFPLQSEGGPIQSRIQSSLRRMASALMEEQSTTRRQMDELRAMNERLTKAQLELVAAERMASVGRLAAGVAHEIGNPLGGILGYVSLAQSKARSDSELSDFLKRVEAEVQRINEIVRGMLDLGRPATGKLAPVEARRLIESTLRLVEAGPEFAQIEVDNEVPADLLVVGAPGPLSQVFLNLLLNAAQAMRSSGRIQLRAERADGRARIIVDDSGPGLADGVREKMFEPFFTTKDPGKGTGLGLAVSLHLIHELGGTLTGENRSEGGARFTVELASA